MTETCIACAQPIKAGDEYFPDYSGGFGHAACFGPEREGYVNLDTGEPIGADEPLPTPQIWPADDEPRSFAATPHK